MIYNQEWSQLLSVSGYGPQPDTEIMLPPYLRQDEELCLLVATGPLYQKQLSEVVQASD